jgi:hypothetical protein
MSRFKQVVFAAILLSLILITGCQHLVISAEKIVRYRIPTCRRSLELSPVLEPLSPLSPIFWR